MIGKIKMDQIQRSHATKLNRYPRHFTEVSRHAAFLLSRKKGASPVRILSFGCSTGEELISIREATNALCPIEIFGWEVMATPREAARLATENMHGISLIDSHGELSDMRFDVILAMAVLCKYPESKESEDISEIYSFAAFDTQIAFLDSLLNVGGLLIVHEANYRVEDSSISTRYRVDNLSMKNSGYVPKFLRSGRRLSQSVDFYSNFIKVFD